MGTQPEPDTKDWTWVLERTCPECEFDTSAVGRRDLAGLARSLGASFSAALSASDDPAKRPEPTVWSALEYGCHVRDVFDLGTVRLGYMLEQDGVTFENWDQDATAIEENYAEQDPSVVSEQIGEAADRFAAAIASIHDDEWMRRGVRSDGSAFTVGSFTRYVLHDPAHHLTDITGEKFQLERDR
jgi:hypothetical protein